MNRRKEENKDLREWVDNTEDLLMRLWKQWFFDRGYTIPYTKTRRLGKIRYEKEEFIEH